MQTKKALIEAALFQASRPLAPEELAAIAETAEHEAASMVESLREELRLDHRGIEIFEVDGRYEMRVKRDHVHKVSHLTPYADLSRALLKVLAMIVYKQPITQSDIVKTIGNRAYTYVKELESRGLVETEKHGRTKRLQVTEQFMSYFGISSRKELMDAFKRQEGAEPESPDDVAPQVVEWMASVVGEGGED